MKLIRLTKAEFAKAFFTGLVIKKLNALSAFYKKNKRGVMTTHPLHEVQILMVTAMRQYGLNGFKCMGIIHISGYICPAFFNGSVFYFAQCGYFVIFFREGRLNVVAKVVQQGLHFFPFNRLISHLNNWGSRACRF